MKLLLILQLVVAMPGGCDTYLHWWDPSPQIRVVVDGGLSEWRKHDTFPFWTTRTRVWVTAHEGRLLVTQTAWSDTGMSQWWSDPTSGLPVSGPTLPPVVLDTIPCVGWAQAPTTIVR